jgi:hypothetical protein
VARMKRLQISIEPELDAAVGKRADEEGLSKAEVIRRCVRAQVQPFGPIEEDPLYKLAGTFEGGDPDGAANHDHYIYGPFPDRDLPPE